MLSEKPGKKTAATITLILLISLTGSVTAQLSNTDKAQSVADLPKQNSDRINLVVRQSSTIQRITNTFTNNLLAVSLDQNSVGQGETVTGTIYGNIDPVAAPGESTASCDGDQVEIKIDWFDPSGSNVATDWVTASECDYVSIDYSFSVWSDAEYGEWEVQAEYRHEDSGEIVGDAIHIFGSDTYQVEDQTTDTTSDSDGDGVNEENDECPGTPSGVSVDSSGCAVDSDGDGVADYVDSCPDTFGEGSDGCPTDPNIEAGSSDIPVSLENGRIRSTVDLVNNGDGDMSQSNIVEMQVRPQGSGLLSFISSSADACDSDYPENVHKEFRLDSGDSRSISLSTSVDNVERGQTYDIYIVTVNACYPDNDPVDPYGSGVLAGSVSVPTLDSDGDGVPDSEDECSGTEPGVEVDSNGCAVDSDGDGVPDYEDEFPDDPDCVEDTDLDGVCDSNDEFPNDADCVEDTDGDGVCDSKDAYPDDPTRTEEDTTTDSTDDTTNTTDSTDGTTDTSDNTTDTGGTDTGGGSDTGDTEPGLIQRIINAITNTVNKVTQ